jgi:hypothetical protein
MRARHVCLWFAALAAAFSAVTAVAQELRVYTATHDLGQPGEPVISSSLTLFHAGKVYDYIRNQNEVTVYEPVQRRFRLLQINAGTAAEVSQDQIRRYIAIAEDKVRDQSQELARQPGSKGALELLEFQLHPKFERQIDAVAGQMKFTSPRCRYEIESLKAPEPAIAQAYLKYADSLSELNAVLNPQSLLPGPRLQVNQELREQGVLPRTVRRQVVVERTSDLRVEHEWKWRLDAHERQMIAYWETLLAKKDLRWVAFEQFQHEVLSGRMTQR